MTTARVKAAAAKPLVRMPAARKLLTEEQARAEDDAATAKAFTLKTDARVLACGVPPRLRDDADKPIDTMPSDARGIWTRAFGKISEGVTSPKLFGLIGEPGTMKSTLGARVVLDVCRKGDDRFAARYTTAEECVAPFSEANKFHSRRSTAGEMERLCRPTFLVIDELHRPAYNEVAVQQLQSLVLRRWDLKRTTLLISNATRETFDDLVGPFVLSRMNELDGGRLFIFGYADLRGRETEGAAA